MGAACIAGDSGANVACTLDVRWARAHKYRNAEERRSPQFDTVLQCHRLRYGRAWVCGSVALAILDACASIHVLAVRWGIPRRRLDDSTSVSACALWLARTWNKIGVSQTHSESQNLLWLLRLSVASGKRVSGLRVMSFYSNVQLGATCHMAGSIQANPKHR